MGNLDKIWLSTPQDVEATELKAAFKDHFGREWDRVLDTAERFFAYNAWNNTYFAVRNLCPLKDLTLDRLLGENGIGKPPNVIVS